MNVLTASTWINQSGMFLVFCTTTGRWGKWGDARSAEYLQAAWKGA